ncbi:translation elongation factor 4 [Patescibacteria group bacterium]|nr:translation elongation factor 4 [Patescibacteria group bacterium]MCL5410054.1 translation elongation factor 4 [Patescibacteria group bacterium]
MNIRNFSIIAHVDHGKSTLADRLLEVTETVPKNKLKPQLLDSLELERERGITIKLAPVRMSYLLDSKLYILNLIDTPGHVDFSYEVSRSLAAVEGAILLVDATQGVQAQTLSHGLAALEQNLSLIPVINKIDMASADVEKCKKQLVDTFGFNEKEILLASGKTGQGVTEILQAVIDKIPSPPIAADKPLKALIFDSFFDAYKGVVAQVRIVEGEVPKQEDKIKFLGTKAVGEVLEKGYFSPTLMESNELVAGEIGYIATGIKEPDLVRVGDTISELNSSVVALPGYKTVKPMVYVGLYPIEQANFADLREVLSKFKLNDPAFSFANEHSSALGAGFRCGFLGLLHAEVVQQRLSEEYGMDLLATTPSVEYLQDGKPITNPADLPQGENISNLQEPWVSLKIFVPQNYLGNVMDLVAEKRGLFVNQQYFGTQVELEYQMPLSEMITDFYDKLKSVSSGFASLDWDFLEYREVDAVRVDIMVGGEKIDALSTIVIRHKAESYGRQLVQKLKEVLPRQNFEIALQAAVGGKIIARETISPFRKDVTAKLYGGDRTRKDKLLEKQKKGKRKMKMIGKVEIPQEAFLNILKS